MLGCDDGMKFTSDLAKTEEMFVVSEKGNLVEESGVKDPCIKSIR